MRVYLYSIISAYDIYNIDHTVVSSSVWLSAPVVSFCVIPSSTQLFHRLPCLSCTCRRALFIIVVVARRCGGVDSLKDVDCHSTIRRNLNAKRIVTLTLKR